MTILASISVGLLILLCIDASHAQQPYPNKPGWVLHRDHSDEFDGTQLDKDKWETDIPPWGTWTWSPSNVLLKDGKLVLKMTFEPHLRNGQMLYYKSGIVRSKASPRRYGYFEISARSPKRDSGVAPAFWAFKATPLAWTEIDFVELTQHHGNPRRVDFNTHVFREATRHNKPPLREPRSWQASWHPSSNYHVYACEWDPSYLKWYVDGVLVAHRLNTYWHQSLDVVLSMGLRAPLIQHPSSVDFPAAFEIDYVRIWSRPSDSTTP